MNDSVQAAPTSLPEGKPVENTLTQVIEAEKEIQKSLELEKNKVDQWLEGVKKTIQAEFADEENRMRAKLEQSRSQALKECEKKAAAIVTKAEHLAEALAQLKAKPLKTIVEKHIGQILPG